MKLLKYFLFFFIFIQSNALADSTYIQASEHHSARQIKGFAFNSDGTILHVSSSQALGNGVNTSRDDKVYRYTLSTGFDLSTMSESSTNLVIKDSTYCASNMQQPSGLAFNGDGTRIFVANTLDGGTLDACQIDVDSAFDAPGGVTAVSTKGILVNSGDTDVGDSASSADGLAFNSDGSKLFLTNDTTDKIYEFSLTTNYDLGTATYSNNSYEPTDDSFSNIEGIAFNNDGTLMFVVESSNDEVLQYSLSTGFDLSSTIIYEGTFDKIRANYLTASGLSSGHSHSTAMTKHIGFNNDGTKFYVSTGRFINNNDRQYILEYNLNVAYQILEVNPTLSSSSPSDGATSVGVNDNITLTFDEIVDAESGNITIKKCSDDSTVETIDITGAKVSGSGSTTITLNPSTTLDKDTCYYINIAATVFDDTAGNSYAGISNSTDLNFTTESTSDPFDDKSVVALVEAQTEAPKRIIQHITTPVYNRLNWLRGRDENSSLNRQSIKFQISNPIINSLVEAMPISSGSTGQKAKKSGDWSFWSEGSVSIGKIGDTTTSLPKDINTNGITVGMDTQSNKGILHGYAFTYTKDDVDVGSSGTSLDIDSYNISKYVTFHQDENKFTEGTFGISKIDLKHIRKSGSNILHGDRDGQQIYGSINYIRSIKSNNLTISPSVKVDISHTILEDYSETGTNALNYKKQDIQTGALYTGIMFDNIIEKNDISFRPNFGMEFGLDFSPSSDAEITYVSDPNTKYTRSIDQQDASGSISAKTKIGLDVMAQTGWSMITLYERNQSENSHSDTFYFGTGYIPMRKEEKYAMVFSDNKASLEYFKNINGLNIKFDTNYELFSEVPDYGMNLKISSKF